MAKKTTRKKPEPLIPGKFKPLFWEQADSRLGIVREIKSRCDELIAQTGADSVQKQILCQRAVFIVTWLETQERQAVESGSFDPGPYTQAVNTLMGLLKTLGLNKARKAVANLKQYVEAKNERH